jgi:hypothetical protein
MLILTRAIISFWQVSMKRDTLSTRMNFKQPNNRWLKKTDGICYLCHQCISEFLRIKHAYIIRYLGIEMKEGRMSFLQVYQL